MTATHPSPEAMEAEPGQAAVQAARGYLISVGVGTSGKCQKLAREFDAFARARVEEENRACEQAALGVVERIKHTSHRDGLGMGSLEAEYGAEESAKAISARRGRG